MLDFVDIYRYMPWSEAKHIIVNAFQWGILAAVLVACGSYTWRRTTADNFTLSQLLKTLRDSLMALVGALGLAVISIAIIAIPVVDTFETVMNHRQVIEENRDVKILGQIPIRSGSFEGWVDGEPQECEIVDKGERIPGRNGFRGTIVCNGVELSPKKDR